MRRLNTADGQGAAQQQQYVVGQQRNKKAMRDLDTECGYKAAAVTIDQCVGSAEMSDNVS
eukprot:scaffold149754_cov24-Tisochrysis_lutea.AAC.1